MEKIKYLLMEILAELKEMNRVAKFQIEEAKRINAQSSAQGKGLLDNLFSSMPPAFKQQIENAMKIGKK